MKNLAKLVSFITIFIALALLSVSGKAQESTLRSYSPHFIEDGFDIRAGAGLKATTGDFYQGMKDEDGLNLMLDASYTNGNFYFIANEVDGVLLGYSVLRDDNWVVDVVFGPKFEVNFDDKEMFDGQLKHLENRDVDGQFGARFSWYGDSNRVSMAVTRDVVGVHHGFLATLDYQQEWQMRNWLVTGRAGLSLISESMTNHMVGVSSFEATASIPAYQAKAGQAALLEIKFEYPVNENWIFETKATVARFSEEFNKSPIIKDDTISVLTTGLIYQF